MSLKRANTILLTIVLFASFSCKSGPVYPGPPVKGDEVVIDVSSLKDATPEFYSFTSGSKTVNFFVLKINNSVESYFDACMKCYHNKMGYRPDGFHLECRYCNVKYPLDSLKTGIGSCYPIQLKGKLRWNAYIISTGEIKEGERFF